MSPLKKFAIGASILMALGVLAFVAYGFTLPSTWVVERSVRAAASPADIHPLVETPGEWKVWAMGQMASQPDLKVETFGPTSGAGAGYTWNSEVSVGKLTITASDPSGGVAYEMVMEANDTPANGTIRYAADGDGTRVTWHDEGDFGKPFGGYMVGIMEQQLGAHLETSLDTLKTMSEARAAARQKAEQEAAAAAPTPAP